MEKRLQKQLTNAQGKLNALNKQDFSCAADALQAAQKLSTSWKYHRLDALEIQACPHYNKAGRPAKNQSPDYFSYRIQAQVVRTDQAI